MQWDDATHPDEFNNPALDANLNSTMTTRSVPMQMTVGRHGSTSQHSWYGSRDTHSEQVLLLLPAGGKVWLRLVLSFSDSASTKKVVAIRRAL